MAPLPFRRLEFALLSLFMAGLSSSCTDEPGSGDDDDSSANPLPEDPDLTSPLEEGEVRAGQITTTDAVWEGISAEARPGDWKLYSACARFAIRGLREGPYFIPGGGNVIDADAARPEGQAGGDIIDDHFTMAGFARILVADSIELVDDGSESGLAHLRVTGHGEPLTLVLAATGAWDLIPSLELLIVQDYTLAADACALRMETTVTNREAEEVSLSIGDGILLAQEDMALYLPEAGFTEELGGDVDFLAGIGRRNQLAMMMWPLTGSYDTSITSILSGVGPVMAGMEPSLTLAPGESTSSTRLLAVGPEPSILEEERRLSRSDVRANIEGYVRDDTGSPVNGARVHFLDDSGIHRGLAFTDETGHYRLVSGVYSGQVIATGKGDGEQTDVPSSWSHQAPWALPEVNERGHGASLLPPPPFADGYVTSTAVTVSPTEASPASADLVLGRPGFLRIRTVDESGMDVPARVRVAFPAGDPTPPDERIQPDNPDDSERLVWTRGQGEVDVPVEPGTYNLLAHRGHLSEYDSQEGIAVEAGQTVPITLAVPAVYQPSGWLTMDSHQHASPSIDGSTPMEDRLVVNAAVGVDLHIGTDHDAVADYGPVLSALELEPFLATVVAMEVSPVLSGHYTILPLLDQPDERGHGSVLWYAEPMTTTDIFNGMRSRLEEGGVIQVAHGLNSSGLFNISGYDLYTGVPGREDYWATDFQSMEVIPGGDGFDWPQYLPVWYSLLRNGMAVAPVCASDSHSRTGGSMGYGFTWVEVGVDEAQDVEPATLAQAIRGSATVASTGPFVNLMASTAASQGGPGSHLSGDSIEFAVEVWGTSWMGIDEVRLMKNGELLQVEAVDEGLASPPLLASVTFQDSPDEACFYTVEVEGNSRDLSPVYPGRFPFAVTGAVWWTE